MKVEAKVLPPEPPKFEPVEVRIVLESEKEVDMLVHVFRCYGSQECDYLHDRNGKSRGEMVRFLSPLQKVFNREFVSRSTGEGSRE